MSTSHMRLVRAKAAKTAKRKAKNKAAKKADLQLAAIMKSATLRDNLAEVEQEIGVSPSADAPPTSRSGGIEGA